MMEQNKERKECWVSLMKWQIFRLYDFMEFQVEIDKHQRRVRLMTLKLAGQPDDLRHVYVDTIDFSLNCEFIQLRIAQVRI